MSGVMPPEASSVAASPATAARPRASRPASCCRAAGGRRRPRAPPRTSASVAHSTSTGTPGGRALERPPRRLPHPACERDVVVLHEHRVVEAHAVVAAAAGRDGLLLERAQARASSCGCRAPRRRCPRSGVDAARGERSRSRRGAARKLSATRSPVSRARASPSSSATIAGTARFSHSPSGPRGRHRPADRAAGRPPRATSSPNTTPGLLLLDRARARAGRARRPPRSSGRDARRPRRAPWRQVLGRSNAIMEPALCEEMLRWRPRRHAASMRWLQ